MLKCLNESHRGLSESNAEWNMEGWEQVLNVTIELVSTFLMKFSEGQAMSFKKKSLGWIGNSQK